ncbi:MAG: hypothetical protein HZA77_02710 [Candidatus Schekmanbacteria bacterium]|nr:hypothetical protein [Candidatus Schekmanbacteria bacterium]
MTETIKRAWVFKGTIRRYFICRFKPAYIEEQLKKRTGSCLQCGKCCDMSIKCPLLKKCNDTISCRIYSSGRPKSCILFPIDRRDIADVGNICGYSFND